MGQYIKPTNTNYLNLSGGTVTGDTYFTKILSATTFYGDGSQLSGIPSPTGITNYISMFNSTGVTESIITQSGISAITINGISSANIILSANTNLYDIFLSDGDVFDGGTF